MSEAGLPSPPPSTVWHPGSQMQLVSVDDKQLTLWKLAETGTKVSTSQAQSEPRQDSAHCCRLTAAWSWRGVAEWATPPSAGALTTTTLRSSVAVKLQSKPGTPGPAGDYIIATTPHSLHHYYITPPSFSFTLEQPHGPCVRGMDFNPNKPYHFASCGDDCTVKYWDSRKLDTPLIVRQDHSHWYADWSWDRTQHGVETFISHSVGSGQSSTTSSTTS